MTRFNDRLREERMDVSPLKMRIGIHSGPVVVGTLGNNLRVEFKAVGETVNLASRMEGLAEPGTIYVSGDTFKLTEGLFRFEAIGDRHVKGMEAPVAVYRVIAPSTRKTRFDVNAERGLTPFVGRDRELELLLDSLERVKEGSGQAFSIIGEAGIGKSRFLYELRKAITNEDITFLEGKCLSYGKGTPYHPISDILKGNFEIREDDADDTIREKVKKSLETLKAEEATALPYLLELLAVKDSGIDRIPLSSEGRKDRIIEAVKQIILKGAQIRPLVIAIEDLHWADQATEDALKVLLEAIPGVRVLIIFTYRPEFVHTWGGRSYHNQITLNRLSNRETLVMVSNLFGTDVIDTELQSLILSKAEGVPFFIEEFVKSLKDLEVIKREDGKVFFQGDSESVALPSTIQDMIMARVDRLSEPTKAVLQISSAIEREFTHPLIQAVTELPEAELLSHLSALKDAELLYERGVYPQSSYIFRHALTREVIYSSILARRRKELHRKIGTSIEALFKDALADHYEILSEHFFLSKDYAKAAEYFKGAAKKAERNASLTDAIAHTRKRVMCLEKSSEGDVVEKERIDARTILGLYLNEINHWVEAGETVRSIARLARKKGYRRRLGQIQTVMGCYYGFIDEDFSKAFEAFDEAFRIATEQNDVISLILSGLWSGIFYSYDCDFEKARNSIQRGLDISTAAKSLWGIASMKAQFAYFCYYYEGKINALMELSSDALEIAQESGDPISMGMSHATYGTACYTKGYLEDAESHTLEGKNLCERIGFQGWATNAWVGLAEIYFEMKKYHKSWQCHDRASRIMDAGKFTPSWVSWNQLAMARCEVMIGERDVDLGSLRAIPGKNRMKVSEGWTFRFLGEILLNIGDSHITEAAQWIRKAIEADARNGMKFHLGLDHALYSDYYKRKGDRTKAQEELGKAIEILQKCGADGWIKKFEKALAGL
jgi:predicted ATPase